MATLFDRLPGRVRPGTSAASVMSQAANKTAQDIQYIHEQGIMKPAGGTPIVNQDGQVVGMSTNGGSASFDWQEAIKKYWWVAAGGFVLLILVKKRLI